MKQLTLLLLLIIAQVAHGQSLSVFDVDASNFPTMRAKFYAFDAAGNQIKNLSPTDFKVTENGTERTKKTVTCPNSIPVAVSSVLVFDMSGSMSGGPPRIESARNAANAWVDGLPAGNSECALVSFDHRSMILHDFTTDRTKLKNSIALLNPNGGTNYNQALIDEPSGGLQIARTGKNKKVLIFLTDGQPNFEPRTQDIIAFAQQYEITIYAVTLDMPAPQCIKDMTKQTGGQYFENITTLKEAEETYQTLLQLATSVEPCEITWESEVSCTSITDVGFEITKMALTDNASYQSPNTSVANLEFNPPFIRFENPTPGEYAPAQTVTVTAHNADFTINDITTKIPVGFDITPKNFPITLKAGQSMEFTVTYFPADSGYNNCRFDVESVPCPTRFYVNGGWKGKKPTIRTIRLIHPNGGESFVAGSDAIITWEGVSSDEPVSIKYSINNGANWIPIADTATGLSYKWRVPKTPSNQCLAIVTAAAKTSSYCDTPEVEICDKIWMGCNLDVDTYRNGDPIPEVTDATQWANLKTGAWCYYNNDPANGEIYGKLYNWYAVNDPRGLAPEGWHVATDEEWTELVNCLGGRAVAGGKLKSTGTTEGGDGLWLSPNTGATNEVGFSALPGGIRNPRNSDDTFTYTYKDIGDQSSWWSSLESNTELAYSNYMGYNYSSVGRQNFRKQLGISVRCVRD